jgi:hypothetical protein
MIGSEAALQKMELLRTNRSFLLHVLFFAWARWWIETPNERNIFWVLACAYSNRKDAVLAITILAVSRIQVERLAARAPDQSKARQ